MCSCGLVLCPLHYKEHIREMLDLHNYGDVGRKDK